MVLAIIRTLYFVICTGAIATFSFNTTKTAPVAVNEHPLVTFFVLEAFAMAFVLIDVLIPRKRIDIISAVYFGLLIGVLLSILFSQATAPMFAPTSLFFGVHGPAYHAVVTQMATLVLSYLSITFLLQTKDDFRFVIPYVEFARELKGGRPLILDSSALIDGRIADVIDTHIVDAELVVPQFVLQEIQEIADSGDKLRRSRGRRGLDILKRLQQDPEVDIRVHQADAARQKNKSIDQMLIELGQELNGRIVTNDFNLNKLASVQGLHVINLNDVANSLKPRFIPGEHLRLKLVKRGESPGQGVGYLDDGTMVVCEQGAGEIDNEVDLVVTSVLQNSAGRMIFGRLNDAAPARATSGASR